MSISSKLMFWGAALILFAGAVLLFQPILMPFVLGTSVAYLLNPVVNKISDYGFKRWISALIIVLVFFVIMLGGLAIIIPVLISEANQLFKNLPLYIDSIQDYARTNMPWVREALNDANVEEVKSIVKGNAGKIFQFSGGILAGLGAGGQVVFGLVSLFILAPIVSFFMMKEWPNIVKEVENLYPKDAEKTMKDLLKRIDQKIAGFVRGQLSVCLVLGIIYAVALFLAGLNYGILIGLGAGLLSIIPMVGSILGFLVSVIVAWFQTGELSYVGLIAGIFIAGQILEGNFLTPKLVGDSVGLHPLWIMFALMAGGSLLGILGMLLAVPVAAIIGVLLGFAKEQYQKSDFYKKSGKQAGKQAEKKSL